MSGELISELILWLIVAVVVIAIVYWVMQWLHRRSTKETAFVRTGFLGEKVVIDGGAFVWPIIHDQGRPFPDEHHGDSSSGASWNTPCRG